MKEHHKSDPPGEPPSDPASLFLEQFSKILHAYQLPAVNLEVLLKSQHRNIEALTAAHKLAYEGLQELTCRQRELLQSMDNIAATLGETLVNVEGVEISRKQKELCERAFLESLTSLRDQIEIVSGYHGDVLVVLKNRVEESFQELWELVQSPGDHPASPP